MKKSSPIPPNNIVVNYAKRKWKVFVGDHVFEVKNFEEAIKKRKEMEKEREANSPTARPSAGIFSFLLSWLSPKSRRITG